MASSDRILDPGRNCWRIERAERFAVLVDAARYFEVVADAIEQAQHHIVILGWDVHSLVTLRRGDEPDESSRLGKLLEAAAERGVQVRLLIWDFSLVFALEREFLPSARFGWATHANMSLRLASDHPSGASHHQKVVVVDGALAFSGGIDLTDARWDRRGHALDEPARVTVDGEPYGPFHDIHAVVDGPAARALGELVAERWEQGTGQPLALKAPSEGRGLWPTTIEPDAIDVDVGISRTVAAHPGREPSGEIEQLYLDSIAAAEQSIYIENQYTTAPQIREALAARLRDPEGPEIVLVTLHEVPGRLEQLTIGQLRDHWMTKLREADHHERLRIVTPTVRDIPVSVHAKVTVIDDRLLRIGSANLTRRSMRMDSECDLVIESGDDPGLRMTIARIRNELLAEHLGVDVGDVEFSLDREDSLLAMIDELDVDGRLRRLDLEIRGVDALGAVFGDPGEPLEVAFASYVLCPEPLDEAQRRWPRVVAVVAAFLALAGVWAWSPLKEWVDPQILSAWITPVVAHPLGPLVFGVAATLLSIVAVPITALIVAAGVFFGPWLGMAVSAGVSLTSAAAGYGIGRGLLRDSVHDLLGDHLARVHAALQRRGMLSVIAVRVVPVAPFTVVNIVAGSAHISLRDYMIGTVLGMAPGMIALTLTADRIAAAARHPSLETLLYALVILAIVAAGSYALRRWTKAAATVQE